MVKMILHERTKKAGSKRRPRRRLAVNILILADQYATVAEATLLDMQVGVLDGGLFVATGSAKKEPGDTYDPVIDFDLAVGRALIKLGQKMVRSGNRAVREAAAEQARAGVEAKLRRRMRSAPRHAKPSKEPASLEHILEKGGPEAAARAAKARGVEYTPPGRDNGLPTVDGAAPPKHGKGA